MKKQIGTMLGLALMMAGMCDGDMFMIGDKPREYDPEDEPKPKRVIPAGCREYSFYGYTVVALNEKSAIKKCKKLAGIK